MYDINSFSIKKDPVILGLESSCDETAAAVIRGRKLLSSCIISSATEQAKFGGVVPEIASRAHTEAVDEVVRQALVEAGKRAAIQEQTCAYFFYRTAKGNRSKILSACR